MPRLTWKQVGLAFAGIATASSSPWWLPLTFPETKSLSIHFTSCGWGPDQDAKFGKCDREAVDHIHFGGGVEFCQTKDLTYVLPEWTYLVQGESTLKKDDGPGATPMRLHAAVTGPTTVQVCGYYKSAEDWPNSLSMFTLTVPAKDGGVRALWERPSVRNH